MSFVVDKSRWCETSSRPEGFGWGFYGSGSTGRWGRGFSALVEPGGGPSWDTLRSLFETDQTRLP